MNLPVPMPVLKRLLQETCLSLRVREIASSNDSSLKPLVDFSEIKIHQIHFHQVHYYMSKRIMKLNSYLLTHAIWIWLGSSSHPLS